MPDVTEQDVKNEIVKYLKKNSRENWFKYSLEIAGAVGIPFAAAILSWTTFTLQRNIERSNIEQTAVENYLLQMEDILINLEGVEGIIKWSKVAEKDARDFDQEIKTELKELEKISLEELKQVKDDLSENDLIIKISDFPNLNLDDDNNPLGKSITSLNSNTNSILTPLNNNINDILTSLEKLSLKKLTSTEGTNNISFSKKVLSEIHKLSIAFKEIEDLEDKVNKINNLKVNEINNLKEKLNEIEDLEEKLNEIGLQTKLNKLIEYYQVTLSAKNNISKVVNKIIDIEKEETIKIDSFLLDEAKKVIQNKTSNVLFILTDKSRRQAIIEFLREANLGFESRKTGDGKTYLLMSGESDLKLKECNSLSTTESDETKESNKTEGEGKVSNNDSSVEYKPSTWLYGTEFQRIKSITLSSNDLSFIQLQYGKLNGANLTHATLSGVNLSNSFLIGANLEGAYLVPTNFENAFLTKANLNNTKLIDSIFIRSKLQEAQLNSVNQEKDEINVNYLSVVKNLLTGIKYIQKEIITGNIEKVIKDLDKVRQKTSASNYGLEIDAENISTIIEDLEQVQQKINTSKYDIKKVTKDINTIIKDINTTVKTLEQVQQEIATRNYDLEIDEEDIKTEDIKIIIKNTKKIQVNATPSKFVLDTILRNRKEAKEALRNLEKAQPNNKKTSKDSALQKDKEEAQPNNEETSKDSPLVVLKEYLKPEEKYLEDDTPTNIAKKFTKELINDIKGIDNLIFLDGLSNIDFRCADLKSASLIKSDFSGSLFLGANLESAKLEESNLSSTNFFDANLKLASLKQSDFSNSSFKGANLEGADFQGTLLKNTNLDGANLVSAKNLKKSQIKLACNWENAFYDKDFRKKLDKYKPKKQPDCSQWGEKESGTTTDEQ